MILPMIIVQKQFGYLLIQVIDVLLDGDVGLHVAIVAVGAASGRVEAGTAVVIKLTGDKERQDMSQGKRRFENKQQALKI